MTYRPAKRRRTTWRPPAAATCGQSSNARSSIHLAPMPDSGDLHAKGSIVYSVEDAVVASTQRPDSGQLTGQRAPSSRVKSQPLEGFDHGRLGLTRKSTDVPRRARGDRYDVRSTCGHAPDRPSDRRDPRLRRHRAAATLFATRRAPSGYLESPGSLRAIRDRPDFQDTGLWSESFVRSPALPSKDLRS